MSARIYSVPDELGELRVEQTGMTRHLAPSDVPVAFEISHEPGSMMLVIRMRYAHATEEPETTTTAGRVQARIGIHSGRLFELMLDLGGSPGTHQEELADSIRRNVKLMLDNLNSRARSPGSKMNYSAAGAGLQIDVGHAPPAWLLDATESLRTGQRISGVPGGRRR